MEAGVDVIIDADAARAPFAELIGLGRQGLERRAIDLTTEFELRHLGLVHLRLASL